MKDQHPTNSEPPTTEPPDKVARQQRKAEKKAAKRRRRMTRLATIWSVGIAAAALAYALVVAMYGESAKQSEFPSVSDTSSVAVYLEPTAVKPAERDIVTSIAVAVPDALLDPTGKLKSRLTISFWTSGPARTRDAQTLTFPAGTESSSLRGSRTLTAETGRYANYPLDGYGATLEVAARSDSAPDDRTYLPTEVAVWGDIPGWQVPASITRSESVDDPATAVIDPYSTIAEVPLQVNRSGSTVAIVVLLLGAMVALAALAMVLANAVSRRRRRTEATLASWFAALLFAVIPLRLNMPGSPPIGVWMDFLVFLWVVLTLMAALTIFVLSWLRFSLPPESRKSATKKNKKNGKNAKPKSSAEAQAAEPISGAASEPSQPGSS